MALEKIKISEIAKIEFVVPDKRMTIKQAYDTYKYNGRPCDFICNGTLFDMNSTSKSTITYGIDSGAQIGYLFDSEGIKIVGDNNISWGNISDKDAKDVICGSPRLVKNGKVDINWGNKVSSYLKNPAIRTAIGFDDTHFVMCVSDNNNTLEGMANYMKNNGCNYACSLDGGGSTSMIKTVDGNMKYVRNTSRLLANFIMVWLKDKTIIDKGDDEVVTKETISVDGVDKEFNTIVKDGVTYMEMRKLAESVDCVVVYDSATKKKSITRKK